MPSASTVLIIEDHQDIVELLAFHLKKEGFGVDSATDGVKGIEKALSLKPSLILLDLMLPGKDGFQVCDAVRRNASTRSIPIIMLTAKGEEADIVTGLEMGADDYVTKPFSPKELLARVKAVLRRNKSTGRSDSGILEFHSLTIDPIRHEVRLSGNVIATTLSEFRILHALISSPGRVFTRDQLIEKIGGPDLAIVDRNIDVHMSALRKKLGSFGTHILTVRGVGYRIEE